MSTVPPRGLRELVGAPLLRFTRDGVVQTFAFGAWVRRERRPSETPSIALEVECAWRLVMEGEFFTGSSDIFRSPHLPPPADFDPTDSRNVCDVRMQRFLHDHAPERPRVRAAAATPSGDLRIDFAEGTWLELFAERVPETAWRLVVAGETARGMAADLPAAPPRRRPR